MTETSEGQGQGTTGDDAVALAVPEKPALEGLEAKWSAVWRENQTYAFDRTQPRENVYSIDTPPPTVSGSLHVGHAMCYSQPDLVVRYRRMTGETVFYPMGFDDNGLPTERYVEQNCYGVRCDPSLPYDDDFTPPEKPDPKKQPPISRARVHRALRGDGPGGREGLRGPLAHARPVGRLVADLHDGGHQGPGDQSARLPAQLRPR